MCSPTPRCSARSGGTPRLPATANQCRTASSPFGGGYRRCIGFAFAELELRALIAELARRTELSLAKAVHPTGVATMWPRGGVPVTVRTVRPPSPL
ncbi:cytochrome P450 [Streptomyces sp. NBC_01456]|uniref:cytochrome P450 n=1 Tax=unclassified Streptomyces TaxID=2593676 RepID=UPI003FCD3837